MIEVNAISFLTWVKYAKISRLIVTAYYKSKKCYRIKLVTDAERIKCFDDMGMTIHKPCFGIAQQVKKDQYSARNFRPGFFHWGDQILFFNVHAQPHIKYKARQRRSMRMVVAVINTVPGIQQGNYKQYSAKVK